MASEIAASMGGFAIPASRLVSFDKEITNSIDYVFGNTVPNSPPNKIPLNNFP